ncbi:MAG: bifunctional acetate--CoA ligase family protein/GNAT family N-acetyltransferase [Tepidisphaerales bacterium]
MPKPTNDPSHDFLRQEGSPLDCFFQPQTVAVIGATETPGSVGRTLLWNLLTSPFGGTVFPVNPKRANVLGVKAYPNVTAIPEAVDLAVIITPAPTVPALVEECARKGVKGAIIISAGFKETGPAGLELERKVLQAAKAGRMRIVGPNCLGVMNPLTGLNATFAKGMAKAGKVAFVSQSGALLTAVLDWSFREQVGFSACVSMGSMLDVNFGDLIDHLGNDPRTNAILIYMESIGDARSFLSAAREVAMNKPIIVIKAGRTEAAAKAAASHTGSLTGSDEVLDAAFKRVGVLRVNNISDLFYMAEVLSKQPRPLGPKLTILTNAGGPGVLATDALISTGGELTVLSPETIEALSQFLPPAWSHGNPVDILGDAPPERYARALETVAKDPNADGMLVILTPQDMTDPTRTAEALKSHNAFAGKPVLASWMGGPDVAAGEAILNAAGIPTFPFPDTAARAFTYMWRYAENLRSIYQTPSLPRDDAAVDREAARRILSDARKAGRTLLTEAESKQLLSAYCIPVARTVVAETAEQAVAAAESIGYPVVVKLHSFTITHKTDVGGVKLNLPTAAAVREAFEAVRSAVTEHAGAEHFNGVTVQPMVRIPDAYELIIGSSIDPQFGPVLLFGQGGQLVEVMKDRALGLPPLNATLARRMMEQTKIFRALQGVRGRRCCDLPALEQLLVRFSQLIVENPVIAELDINPLWAGPSNHPLNLLALDARVVLHDPSVSEDKLPRSAIRPYPQQYVVRFTLKDGTHVTIRPIRPEDEPMLVHFHSMLSEQSVRYRYFTPLKLGQRVAHERLIRVCFNDYDRDIALVVEHRKPAVAGDYRESEILAVGRLSKVPHRSEGEFALIVRDDWQNRGLGKKLLSMLVDIGRNEALHRITGNILPENLEMQRVAEKVGFRLVRDPEDNLIRAVYILQDNT